MKIKYQRTIIFVVTTLLLILIYFSISKKLWEFLTIPIINILRTLNMFTIF